jgi:hypothetical protein
MVMKNLSNVRKQEEICSGLSEKHELLKQILTGNRIWVSQYKTQITFQSPKSKHLGYPRLKRVSKSKIKIILICFFDIKGIVYYKLINTQLTVNEALHCHILEHL